MGGALRLLHAKDVGFHLFKPANDVGKTSDDRVDVPGCYQHTTSDFGFRNADFGFLLLSTFFRSRIASAALWTSTRRKAKSEIRIPKSEIDSKPSRADPRLVLPCAEYHQARYVHEQRVHHRH